jgi:AraC-like DNA-binding protein
MQYNQKLSAYILAAICIICFIRPVHSSPAITFIDYDPPFRFDKIPAVLLEKGDEDDYALPEYDDSAWNVVSLPINWNRLYPDYAGICWHRIRIAFPEKRPLHSVGIEFGIITDVDEIYFNGKLIGKTGSFGPPRSSAYDKTRIYEIPPELIKKGAVNLVAVKMGGLFDDSNGAYRGSFKIGYFSKLQKDSIATDFFNVLFVVIYITVAFYFGLFFLRHPVDKEYLFFSLFTLFTALYLFLRTQVRFLIFDNFYILKKTEYLILIVIFSMFIEFVSFYFHVRRHRYHTIFHVWSAFNFIGVLITSDYTVWQKILYYSIQPSWLIPVSLFIYLLVRNFRRNRESRFLLGALFILLLTTINDSLLIRAVYNFISLSNYGFMFLIISISLLMHSRYINLYKTLESIHIKDAGRNSISDTIKQKIDQTIEIINESYTSQITREDIAADLNLNPDHLGKLFKKATGKRISDYINELRVNEAARQLLESDKSITEIAFSVGFESMSTFYRIFQKFIGEQPVNYREKNR